MGESTLAQTAVANAVTAARCALSSPPGSHGTTALEKHVLEAAAGRGRAADCGSACRIEFENMGHMSSDVSSPSRGRAARHAGGAVVVPRRQARVLEMNQV